MQIMCTYAKNVRQCAFNGLLKFALLEKHANIQMIFLIRYSFASTTLSTNTAESGRPNPSSTDTDLQKMTIAWQINNLRMIIYSLMLYIVAIIRSCSLLGVVLGLVPAGHDPKQRVSSPAPGGPISCSV